MKRRAMSEKEFIRNRRIATLAGAGAGWMLSENWVAAAAAGWGTRHGYERWFRNHYDDYGRPLKGAALEKRKIHFFKKRTA